MPTKVEIAWAAGLWEGEGWFLTQICKSGSRQYAYPRAGLEMTDRDVVEHLHGVIGRGKVTFKPRSGVKDMWTFRVDATEDVHYVANLLLPWFGERRAAQVERVLSAHRGRIDPGPPWPPHPAPKGQKWCWSCKVSHPVNEFNRNGERGDGLSSSCRDALNAQRRARRSAA